MYRFLVSMEIRSVPEDKAVLRAGIVAGGDLPPEVVILKLGDTFSFAVPVDFFRIERYRGEHGKPGTHRPVVDIITGETYLITQPGINSVARSGMKQILEISLLR